MNRLTLGFLLFILILCGVGFGLHHTYRGIKTDARAELLIADGETNQPFVSAQSFDQQAVHLGYALVWKISDPTLFAEKNKAGEKPLAAIRKALDTSLGQGINLFTLDQLLQTSTQQSLIHNALEKANTVGKDNGIQCIALVITSLDISEEARAPWVAKMQKQQDAALDTLRQQTAALSQDLQSATDKKAMDILSKAQTQADQIRAKAGEEATKIYADAYNQDPDFYQFYHNLQLYKEVLSNKQDVLVFGTDTPFFKSIDATKK